MNIFRGITAQARIRTEIRDAKTGKCVKRSKWVKNLVCNQGLTGLARSGATLGTTAGQLTYCHVGNGTNPNSIASGAVTFTQAGTTVTASGSFFVAGMVGQLFKYGTGSGGAEYYITGYTSPTQVTVDTSATVAVPEVATVWAVNLTGLQTPLYTTNTYQLNSGDNQTTYSTTGFTHKRTYIVAQQASPYTVNEIGYSPVATNNVCGRIVLPSSDVVGTSNFYVVVIQLTFTVSPNVPTAVGNVGTNIDTTGNAMVESLLAFSIINGGTVTTASCPADQINTSSGPNNVCHAYTTNYSQNATPAATTKSNGASVNMGFTGYRTFVSGFTCGWTLSYSTTTSGQTCYGVGLRDNNSSNDWLDVKFTTPQTLPTGTFAGTINFRQTWGRILTN